MANKRIIMEWKRLIETPIDGVNAEVVADDLRQWKGAILGGDDTPYKGGTFKFFVELPENFPFSPPKFNFTTLVYHPGINEHGEVCLAILGDQWRPDMSLRSVLLAIQEKLHNPVADDPFKPDIAQILKENPDNFKRFARQWTETYAKEA